MKRLHTAVRYAVPLCALVALLSLVRAAPAHATIAPAPAAQGDVQPLRIATKPIEPFVIEVDGELDGFSVELWDALAEQLGVAYEWVLVDSVEEQLAAVENGEADAAIAAITINREREAVVDFSYPYFESGLQILTTYAPDSPLRSLISVVSVFLSPIIVQLMGLLILFVLIAAHAVWLVERRHNPDFDKGYLRGIWDGLWWAAVTASTVGYGDKTTKGTIGRILSLVWIFIGLLLITQLTAGVTATLALQHADGRIRDLPDLHDRRVATVEGTTSAEFLRGLRLRPITVDDIDGAIALLEQERVDAVVFDAPVLQYYAATEGEGMMTTVGESFRKEFYGIALPDGSPHRELVDQALLAMMESGEYDTIYASWFGETPR